MGDELQTKLEVDGQSTLAVSVVSPTRLLRRIRIHTFHLFLTHVYFPSFTCRMFPVIQSYRALLYN